MFANSFGYIQIIEASYKNKFMIPQFFYEPQTEQYYIVGGISPGYSGNAYTYIYAWDGNKWNSQAQLPSKQAVNDFTTFVYNDIVYLFACSNGGIV